MIYFALKGYPCLPVHDSFIVDYRLEDDLKEIMEKVFVHNFQKDIPVKDSWEQLILRFTPEKVESELLPKIIQGLEDGTIDRDEFEKDLAEQSKRHEELMKQLKTKNKT
jgi:hypothetical protein